MKSGRERGRCQVQAGILGTSRLAPFVVVEWLLMPLSFAVKQRNFVKM